MGYTHTHTPRWNETECVYEGAITFLGGIVVFMSRKNYYYYFPLEKKRTNGSSSISSSLLRLLSLIFILFFFLFTSIYIGFMSHLVPACLFFYCPLLLYLFFSMSTTLSRWFLISVREAKTGFLISQSEQLFIPPLLDTGARLGQISASGSRR